MVFRIRIIFGVMGSPHGPNDLRKAPYLWASTALLCSVLWFDRINVVLCHQSKPLSTLHYVLNRQPEPVSRRYSAHIPPSSSILIQDWPADLMFT